MDTNNPDPCCTPAFITAEDCKIFSRSADLHASHQALELAAAEIERLRKLVEELRSGGGV